MPVSVIYGCNSIDGYALMHFLLYLGFETRCDEAIEADVVVVSGEECPQLTGKPKVLVLWSRAARSCGINIGPGTLDNDPIGVRVDRSANTIIYREGSLYMVFRELERMLGRAGLLYHTPPIRREEILRWRPG